MKQSLKQELTDTLEAEHSFWISDNESRTQPHDYENCEICKLIAKARKTTKVKK